MSPKTRDDFTPDVGGFLDGMNGDITEAKFEIASGDYADRIIAGGGDAKPGVMLTLTVVSPELERPLDQSFSVGSSDLWDIAADGRSITHTKNPDKHMFRKGSRAWALVEAMMTAVGDGKLEKGQDFFIGRDSYMTQAEFYEKLSFYWETQSLPTVGGQKTNVPLPAKYLGEAKSGSGGGAKAGTVEDTTDLDLHVVANASGKTITELKTWAIKDEKIKTNNAYKTLIVSGKKLKELEESGMLILGEDKKYSISDDAKALVEATSA